MPKVKKFRLKNVNIEEISVCPEPAQEGASIDILKSKNSAVSALSAELRELLEFTGYDAYDPRKHNNVDGMNETIKNLNYLIKESRSRSPADVTSRSKWKSALDKATKILSIVKSTGDGEVEQIVKLMEEKSTDITKANYESSIHKDDEADLVKELKAKKLRLATKGESGNSYTYFDRNDEKRSAWVTDIAKANDPVSVLSSHLQGMLESSGFEPPYNPKKDNTPEGMKEIIGSIKVLISDWDEDSTGSISLWKKALDIATQILTHVNKIKKSTDGSMTEQEIYAEAMARIAKSQEPISKSSQQWKSLFKKLWGDDLEGMDGMAFPTSVPTFKEVDEWQKKNIPDEMQGSRSKIQSAINAVLDIKKSAPPMMEESDEEDEDPKEEGDDPEEETEMKLLKTAMSLSEDQRAHAMALDEIQLQKFLELDDAEREAIAEPIYKSRKGITFTKAHDPIMIEMARELDNTQQAAKIEKSRNAELSLQLRADTELKYLPGSIQARAAILKSIEDESDDTLKADMKSVLVAANESLAKSFSFQGQRPKSGSVEGSPEDQIEKIAKKYADEHKVSIHKAKVAVSETAEVKALYNQIPTRAI